MLVNPSEIVAKAKATMDGGIVAWAQAQFPMETAELRLLQTSATAFS